LEPLPLLDEIRAQPEFSAAAISAEEFEQVWRRACTVMICHLKKWLTR
jgi:hypothetical protein